MARISIELVPRTQKEFIKELEVLSEHYSSFERVNIPDSARFALNSWDACDIARSYVPHAIPHVRACDFDLSHSIAELPFAKSIELGLLTELLIVRGDPQHVTEEGVEVWQNDTTTIDLISAIKSQWPTVKLYAAIDPYRQSLKEELTYAKQKVQAGADGFFTQPFFDIKLLNQYADEIENLLPDLYFSGDIYWGLSPAVGIKSQSYWQKVNRVSFPSDFRPTLDWNRQHSKNAIGWAKRRTQSLYFMPIKVDLIEYLKDILW